jgi:hypothetical protein
LEIFELFDKFKSSACGLGQYVLQKYLGHLVSTYCSEHVLYPVSRCITHIVQYVALAHLVLAQVILAL